MLERTIEYAEWREKIASAHKKLEDEENITRKETIREKIRDYLLEFKSIPKYTQKKAG